ncbi:MAG: OB-fold nucleic acid binding domain-containing protein [Candidatus Syntropharchaeia archaeon]
MREIYAQFRDRISFEEFEKRVKKKMEDMAGLCDERTAAMLVVKDLGIDETMDSEGLKPRTDSISISGEILDIGELRTFKRKDGSEGKVVNLIVGNESGRIRLALWDDHASEVYRLSVGDVIDVENGYMKERYNQVEIHVGRGGMIRKSKKHVKFIPKITKIKDIKLNYSYDIRGKVSGIGSIREFMRKNGEQGRVVNIWVSDESGRIKVSLWGEKVDFIRKIDIGSLVGVRGYATSWNDEMELRVDWRGDIRLLE